MGDSAGAEVSRATSVCLVGLRNLPLIAREYEHHGIGGAELQQSLLGKALARRGYQVSMVVGDYGQADGAEWHGIKTFRAYKEDAGIAGLRFVYPRWTSVWGAMSRADAKIYYTSGANMLVGQIALFARVFNRKSVLRLASDTDCDPRTLRLNSRRHRFFYQYGLRNVDCVLAQTTAQQLTLSDKYGRHSQLAPSLLDWSDDILGFDDRDLSVLWVGNIRSVKRPDLLLQLAHQSPDLDITVVGGVVQGEEALYQHIRDAAGNLRSVSFLGQCPYESVNDLFGRTRVYVNTSDVEGFPNTYLQAWSRGTPVITFLDPDGLIAREGLGCIVSSVEEMRDAIRCLIEDHALWRQTSERCRHFISARVQNESLLAPYMRVFDSLAELA